MPFASHSASLRARSGQVRLFSWNSFIEKHDDLPAFQAASIVFILLSAAIFPIGFFALLVIGHMTLDAVKYQRVGKGNVARNVVRENILDVSLLAFALMASVYLHHGSGLVAVSGIIRSEMFVVRGLATLLPKIKVLCHVAPVFSNIGRHLRSRRSSGWTTGQFAAGWLLALSVGLIAATPIILPMTADNVIRLVIEEMIPWRI